VFGWGDNEEGELGNGESQNLHEPHLFSDVPGPVTGISSANALAVGEHFALALLNDGNVVGWGSNVYGQLGGGDDERQAYTPVPVVELSDVTGIAAGTSHALAVLQNGTVMAWGDDEVGQLGVAPALAPELCGPTRTPSYPCSRAPVQVPGLSEVQAVAAAGYDSVALLRNGTVKTWGAGPGTHGYQPVQVAGLDEVTAITAGEIGVVTALLKDGTVVAWGAGGQLGDGVDETTAVPMHVCAVGTVGACPDGPFLEEVVAVPSSQGESTAVLKNGTVVDWGSNGEEQDQLGSDKAGAFSPVPVVVEGLSGAVAVAGGYYHRFALLRNGTVKAWGLDSLGDGGGSFVRFPVPVIGLTEITAIASGRGSALATTAPAERGATGSMGVTGPAGATGETGAAGVTGATGVTGSTGAAGVTGATGPGGATGEGGVTGATGAQGSTGTQGSPGLSGSTGTTGGTGVTGATGPLGASGTTGAEGATGPTGSSGARGHEGPIGVNGTIGANGPTGLTGATGNAGATGPTGATGPALAPHGYVTTASGGSKSQSLSLTAPDGQDYAVSADGTAIVATPGTALTCTLDLGQTTLQRMTLRFWPTSVPLRLQGAGFLESGSVNLACATESKFNSITNLSLMAIPLSGVN
jgi:alpha-tubulin suppressor-like RCC1 family protein